LDDSAENVENLDAGPAGGGLESGVWSDHARSVENASALSTRRDMFLDERGAGLRVTWHPERDLVVLSVWQGDSCVGTFRMSVQDVPRLSGLLAAALGDWVDQAGPAPGSEGGPGGFGSGADDEGVARGGGGGLSVGRRIRLSRPVLKMRGIQRRRRRGT
jgi:hypothetical protein